VTAVRRREVKCRVEVVGRRFVGPHKSGIAASRVREEMRPMRESENGTAGRQRDRKERNRRSAAAVVMAALVTWQPGLFLS
jgi:hypothetical protein